MRLFADVFVAAVASLLVIAAARAGVKFLRRRLGFRPPWRKP